ncbi:MAG: hypothetical protein LBS90_07665 [Oscillospiraceae bacterium]|jgi:hypothetical protein|nr:hypothetical protein [Oscillospiraceae bacterium]
MPDTAIPKHEIEALARCLFPEIQRFFESENGRREFAEWRASQGVNSNSAMKEDDPQKYGEAAS